MLKIENLSVSYRDHLALENVSLKSLVQQLQVLLAPMVRASQPYLKGFLIWLIMKGQVLLMAKS